MKKRPAPIVIDHGPGAHHRLIESGHRSVDVRHAFISHLHYDHCMDYGRLVVQRGIVRGSAGS